MWTIPKGKVRRTDFIQIYIETDLVPLSPCPTTLRSPNIYIFFSFLSLVVHQLGYLKNDEWVDG